MLCYTSGFRPELYLLRLNPEIRQPLLVNVYGAKSDAGQSAH